MANRKIRVIQIAINADSEGNERIVALREDGEIFTYYVSAINAYNANNPNDIQWRRITSVPDDE